MGSFLGAKLWDTVSITGARLRSTPARRIWRPHSAAFEVSAESCQMACVRAVGILENPGPWRTWTYPPSWSVAMNRGTPAVAVVLDRLSAALVRDRTGGAPAVVRPVRMRFPTWYTEIVPVVADVSPVTGPPTMN